MQLSLNDNTYTLLKREIMTLKLVPGEAISAAKIAARYEVSRTPAREAIVKLSQEGLLEIIPQSKTLVSKINLKRAQQEWFVRSSLEIDMLPAFLVHVTEKEILRLRENQERMKAMGMPEDAAEYFSLDNEFHGIIYETAGEFLAKEIIETHMTHYNRIRFLTDLSGEIRQKTLTEHTKIIEAAEERDLELMQALEKKHIRRIHKEQSDIVARYPEYFQ